MRLSINSINKLLERLLIKANNNPWAYFVALVFVSGIFLGLRTPEYLAGYSESEKIAVISVQGGLSPPPGYPIYSLLLRLTHNLPIIESSSYKLNLLHTLLTSLTIALTVMSGLILGNEWNRAHKKKEKISIFTIYGVSLLLAALVISTFHIALLGVIINKHIFSMLLVSVFTYLGLLLLTGKNSQKVWYFLAITTGLAIGQHQAMLLLILPLLFLVYHLRSQGTFRDMIILILIVLSSWLIPYGYLYYLSINLSEQTSWRIDEGAWMSYIFHLDLYPSWAGAFFTIIDWLSQFKVNSFIESVTLYIKGLIAVISPLLILPLLLIRKWTKNKLFQFLIIVFLVTGPIALGLIPWPTDVHDQAQVAQWYVVALPIGFLCLWFGLVAMYMRLVKASSILMKVTFAKLVAVAILMLPMANQLSLNLYSTTHDYSLPHELHLKGLEAVDENAMVVCFTDISCTMLLYLNSVENIRPDVTVVSIYDDAFSQPSSRLLSVFDYNENPWYLIDIITSQLDERTVYAFGLNQTYRGLLGIDHGFMYYIPAGYFGRLSRIVPDMEIMVDLAILENFDDILVDERDLARIYLQQYIANQYVTNSISFLKSGERDLAQQNLHAASNIYHTLGDDQKKSILSLRTSLEQIILFDDYAPLSRVKTATQLLEYIPDLMEEKLYDRALFAAQGAVIVEPTSLEARLMLAKLYKEVGNIKMAETEFRNALILDPDNEEAFFGLEKLLDINLVI